MDESDEEKVTPIPDDFPFDVDGAPRRRRRRPIETVATSSAALGAVPPSLVDLIPDNMRPHVVLTTPIGTTIIDPLLSSQDETTQQFLQSLGIQVDVIFGPVPNDVLTRAATEPLGRNLGAILAIAGVGLLWLMKRNNG